jgi:Mitochondrial ribosomal protein (VAR1)
MLNKKMNSYLYLKKDAFNNTKLNNNKFKSLFEDNLDYTKYSPAASKEWNNSIYTYNKNSTKNLPTISKRVNKLITSYFNFFNSKIERNIRKLFNEKKGLRIRFRRSSMQKIFVSKTITKHFVSKIIVTVYTFNQEEKIILNKILINKLMRALFDKDYIKEKRIEFVNFIALNLLNNNTVIKNPIYMNYLKRILEQENLRFYYKQLLYINNHKFKYTYLSGLKDLIFNLYNKRIEFNIVNLKVLYLNSDILSQFVIMKVKKTKKNISNLLSRILNVVRLPDIYRYIWSPESPGNIMDNILVSDSDKKISNDLFSVDKLSENINDKVFNSIKNKLTNGVRLEIAGRLSKRSSANRAMFKFKYKGNLRNIDSSFRGVSAVMLRGHLKSNIQYTNLKSKARKGAYGLKGWISSV